MSVDPERIFQIRTELQGTEGWRVRSDISRLVRSWRLFAGNERELEHLLAGAEEISRSLALWSPENTAEREEFLDEVDRLLHNFLAVAFSLVCHSRDTARRLLPPNVFSGAYQRRVDLTFTNSPLAQFVQGLRNVTLHVRLPIAFGYSRWSRKEGLSQRVVLACSYLLARGDWKPLAKQYIEEAGERIVLLEVVVEYSRQVNELQQWLRSALIETHRSALQELEERHAELLKLWQEATGESAEIG